MKSVFSVMILGLAASHSASAANNDICKPVFEACAAAGFTKDETAPAGQKIWLNCASDLLEKEKKVAKVDLDPNSFEVKNCREYRVAKDKFDAEWAAKHKKSK